MTMVDIAEKMFLFYIIGYCCGLAWYLTRRFFDFF